MAGAGVDSFGNQLLWQTISGTGFLRPQSVIEHELNKNREKFLQGLSYYRKLTAPPGTALKDRKLKPDLHDFILKLIKFLGLDELQCHDLFCSFLFTEFKGSQKELSHILNHERSAQALLLKIQDFYFGERLYLLRCLRHILRCWRDEEHAYKDIFDTFLKQLVKQGSLGKKLLSEFDEVCNPPIPNKDLNGPVLSRAQVLLRAHQNLREQAELLELLLVYYKDIEMDLPTLLELCAKFKKHGFGWGQSYKHLVDDGHMEKLVQRIGYLEVLLLLAGLDVMNALEVSKQNNFSEHVILGELSGMEKVEAAISQLGSEPVHGPLLLGWSVLQYIRGEAQLQEQQQAQAADTPGPPPGASLVRSAQRRGQQALQLGVFDFLLDMLAAEPFCGQSDLASIAHYQVYSIMVALLSVYHEDSLGNTEALYRITSKLFKWEFVADQNWSKSAVGPEGLTILYESSKQWFPLDFVCFVQLNISLASASTYSAQQVKNDLLRLQTYTEALDNNRAQDLQTSSEQGVFILRRDKRPFQNSAFTIEHKSKGTVISHSAIRRSLSGVSHVIRWECPFNAWQMLMGEVQELLAQVAQGAGMVQTEQLLKATMVMELVKEVLTSDPSSVPEFKEMLGLGYQLVARFAVLSPCPLELVANTVQCLACAVPQLHSEVSHHLRQTGFLPFLMENIDDFSEVLSGDGVNQGLYGTILAETECAQGSYMVTMATLDLLTELVQSSCKEGKENENLAGVLFILKEVFPRYYKWRYVDIGHRKSIGRKCLLLFHNIFNFVYLQEKQAEPSSTRGPSLRECCVFSLLFTEAGRALLEIVATGSDNVQQALSQQTSLLEGAGSDLVELIEMSLSVLNRLLLLKPPSLSGQPSPVEQVLASSQHGPTSGMAGSISSTVPGHTPFQAGEQRHLVATVAQYIYHRHSYRLPVLATLLLKRLATVSPMSILACLGKDAESIRNMFLTRLRAVSEDIHLKVGILELLSVCVDSQPGLIEIFLNVQTQHGDSTLADTTKPELKFGRSSCLPVLLKLMKQSDQYSAHCPPELLAACMELVHALWAGLRETPMAVLRKSETFWPSVLEPLKKDLPAVKQGDQVSAQAAKLHSKICAFCMRTIALEIFAVSGTPLNASFKTNLGETFTGQRVMYWSQAVRKSLAAAGESPEPESDLASHEQSLWDHPALNLLLAWKNFLITLSKFKIEEVQLTDANKANILHHLLEGVRAQFHVGHLSELKVKLASISSALYFTLLKIWGRELCDRQLAEYAASPRTVSTPEATLRHLTEALTESMGGDTIIPSVLIGLLGSSSLILQHCGQRIDELPSILRELLPVLCAAFLRSSWTLPALLDSMDKNRDGVADQGSAPLAAEFGVQVKLQITCCCLMVEVLHNSQDLNSALKVLQEQGILSSILATTEAFFKSRQGISYVYSSVLLLTKLAESEMGANALVNSNLTSHLCLVLTACYTREDSFQPRNLLAKAFSTSRPATVSWHTLYCLSLDLFAVCLQTLGHAFLEDALNLVGVHQDRLQQSLELARVTLNHYALSEAESTCNFLMQLCRFHREWSFHLPQVMAKLMTSLMAMVQTYVALLIRPRYLLHLLEHTKAGDPNNESKLLLQLPAHLQHQTSLDDVEQPTHTLVDAQHSILKLVVKALLCLKHFTPVLPEILLDQSVDVSEWEPILQLNFGTPSLDGDVAGITFGTLLNCVTACIRLLTRNDSKALSPHKVSPDPKQAQVPKPVIQLALELSLQVLLSQACRYLRDPTLTARDRQFLKSELGTELNSCLSPLHRQMRRSGGDRSATLTPPGSAGIQLNLPGGPGQGGGAAVAVTTTTTTTPQTPTGGGGGARPSLAPQMSRSSSQTFSSTQDPAYFRLVHAFVQKVLK